MCMFLAYGLNDRLHKSSTFSRKWIPVKLTGSLVKRQFRKRLKWQAYWDHLLGESKCTVNGKTEKRIIFLFATTIKKDRLPREMFRRSWKGGIFGINWTNMTKEGRMLVLNTALNGYAHSRKQLIHVFCQTWAVGWRIRFLWELDIDSL